MPLIPGTFGSTYHALEEATPPTSESVAAKHFTSAFAKFMEVSAAGDAVAVPTALYSASAMNLFKSAVTAAFKTPPAALLLPALDQAITAYLTAACLAGLFVSTVSGSATAFTPITPLKTVALPMFVTNSNDHLTAKTKFGKALRTYLGAGQVAFPGPPPITKPIV